jgi:PAT family beta-lactamase induction signal transducer AmpG
MLVRAGLPSSEPWPGSGREAARRRSGVIPVWALAVPDPPPPRSRATLLWTSSSYFGEGLPWSVLHQMATEYLTSIGASKTQISSTSLFHFSVTLKFLWSPIVDLFGTKRRWLVDAQLALGLGMLLVAAVVGTGNLTLFWLVLALLSVLHATHDIACDGFYLSALNQRDQALFSGVRSAAFRTAMIVGSSLLVYLAGRSSWPLAFGCAGALMLLAALLNRRILPHPEQRRPDPGEKGTAFLAAYRSFFTQPYAARVLALMLFYRVGDIMMFAMSKPLLAELGIGTAQRGILNGAGILAAVLGSIAGGVVLARHGLARCLVPMTYVQNLAIPLYILLASARPGLWGVSAIVVLEQLAAGIGAAANGVFLMQRTSRSFSASHFAFATAVVSVGSTLSGFISGPLDERLGHTAFFSLAFVASWPSLVLVHLLPKELTRGADRGNTA